MEHTELGKELSGILGSVHGQSFWNNLKGFGEFSNGKLLSGSEGSSEIIKVDTQGNFDSTSSSDNTVRFQHSLDNTEGVMDRSLNFIKEEIVGSSKDNGLGSGFAHSFEEHVFPVSNSLFVDSFTSSEAILVESLFTFDIGKGDNNLSSSVVGNSLHIVLWHSSNGNDTGFDEILEGEIIDTS
jgi:hypothetical protein